MTRRYVITRPANIDLEEILRQVANSIGVHPESPVYRWPAASFRLLSHRGS
jgi:hypothetical protein